MFRFAFESSRYDQARERIMRTTAAMEMTVLRFSLFLIFMVSRPYLTIRTASGLTERRALS